MVIGVDNGGAIKTQLLANDDDDDDVVAGFADFKGRRAIRSKTGLWKSAYFIIGVEVAEKFAYNGISSNLITYLTGPLGQSTAYAAASVNAWTGTASLLPLLGAFVADSFLGRFRTIIISVLVYILAEDNTFDCAPPPLELVAFYLSLYLAAVGEGGMRPCIQAFGADQFDGDDVNESKSKSSFFNWWYFAMSAGSFVAILILNYIQDNLSWELGFGIPCIVMLVVLLLYLLGSPTYRFRLHTHANNPFARIGRVFLNTAIPCRGCSDTDAEQPRTKFLDRAGCSEGDIRDAKALLGLLPIWFTSLGFAVVFSQGTTLFTKQGQTMDREIFSGLKIPAASLQSLSFFTVIFIMPVYDWVLVPAARSLTGRPAGISMLQRIGAGLFMSLLSMVVAALVETRRLDVAAKWGLVDEAGATLPMSVWWLAPQYVLFGLANVFVLVGLQEFFYDQVPSDLKSIGLALYLSILGIGDFLSSFLIALLESITTQGGHGSWFDNNMNRAHVDYFYWLLAGISAIVMLAYAFIAKSYVYRGRDLVCC
ncbi:protein NRT1/ PTR FAMILY 5.10-like isoform X2 [Salvia splendens]|uniref:protein NRT1/ PTR FAMILY 5.10-like isoform X2 n=1 Tax=Salvia splendens TaxID=180675 RepID=UPI001C26B673|nr:protein NRT1/ PTR FAMILY 5.10-like isoform X2 [Salvia splendens]